MRIFFTGGSGKAGKHVVPYLAGQGHRVMNVDRVPLNHPGVHDLIGRCADAMPDHADLRNVILNPEWGDVLCTEKDAVKLWNTHPQVWAVPLLTELPEALLKAIDASLHSAQSPKLSSPHGH